MDNEWVSFQWEECPCIGGQCELKCFHIIKLSLKMASVVGIILLSLLSVGNTLFFIDVSGRHTISISSFNGGILCLSLVSVGVGEHTVFFYWC